MDPFNIILTVIIISGGFFSLVISFGQLIVKNRKSINYISFALYFIYGMCVLSDATYRMGTEYITPHLLYINYPLLLFLGPVLFFYFRILVGDDIKFKPRYILLFIPGLLVFFYFIPFYIQPAEIKLILYPLYNNYNDLIRSTYAIIDYSLLAWVMLCFLFSFRYTYFLWNKESISNIRFVRVILIYMIVGIIIGMVLAYSDITENFFVYRICLMLTNIYFISTVLISYRYPQFFNIIRRESSKVKYKRSKLKGLNVKSVIIRIEELMEYEQLYSEPDITLNSMSELLEITPHQLSEMINKFYKTNFNSFINNYRIEAAKEILINNPDYNILNIAFKCGFNSKSAFNSAFLKSTGMTPSNFRKKISPDL